MNVAALVIIHVLRIINTLKVMNALRITDKTDFLAMWRGGSEMPTQNGMQESIMPKHDIYERGLQSGLFCMTTTLEHLCLERVSMA